MNANPQTHMEPAISHGQFYKADELVELIYQDFGGFHPDARAVHANGRIYAGEFIATPAAKTLSRAAHFQGNAVPATTRFCGTSGDPEITATATVAMATRFYLPNGTVTDLIGITERPDHGRTAGRVSRLGGEAPGGWQACPFAKIYDSD